MSDAVIHPTAVVSPRAEIGSGVRVGPFAVIHDHVVVGDDSVIGARVSLGEPLRASYTDAAYENPPLVMGGGAIVRSGSVLYAGAHIGERFECGHNVVVREGSRLGSRCRLGTGSVLEGNLDVGEHVTMQTYSHVAPLTVIGDFVWLFPSVTFTNDPAPPGDTVVGSTVQDYAVIATRVTLLPGVRIGEHAVVGADSLVRSDVADGMFAEGRPARVVAPARYLRDRKTGSALYPWPRRFSSGMPWADVGWDRWLDERGATSRRTDGR